MTDVSVVTVNLNNAAGLRRTMASVQAQTCGMVEHVVIDGGSTDESAAVISAGA